MTNPPGAMPPLPETSYQLYYQWPDDEDGFGGSEVFDDDAFTAGQMHAYAQAYAAPLIARVAELEEEQSAYRNALIHIGGSSMDISVSRSAIRDAACAALAARKEQQT